MKRCLFLTLLSLPVSPETLVQTSGPARVLVKAAVESGTVALKFSDMLEVTIEVDGPGDGLEVIPPAKWTLTPGWKIKDVSRPTAKRLDKGQRWRQAFTLDPLAPGMQQIVLESARYRTSGGRWQELTFTPLSVKVTPQLQDGDIKNLREQTPIEELPPRPSTVVWIIAALGGAGVVALFLAWFAFHRRALRIRQRRSPVETALHELERLKALMLPQKDKAEEFHTLLANIVRRFLERQYGLPARRTTTPEFALLLGKVTTLTAEDRDFVKRFLERCDLGKFAGKRASPAECAELESEVRNYLTSRRHRPEVSSPVSIYGRDNK